MKSELKPYLLSECHFLFERLKNTIKLLFINADKKYGNALIYKIILLKFLLETC